LTRENNNGPQKQNSTCFLVSKLLVSKRQAIWSQHAERIYASAQQRFSRYGAKIRAAAGADFRAADRCPAIEQRLGMVAIAWRPKARRLFDPP
jgi:hypothetical protein